MGNMFPLIFFFLMNFVQIYVQLCRLVKNTRVLCGADTL